MADRTPVTFLDAEGNEISNDPIWHAQKTLRDAGVTFEQSQPTILQEQLKAAAASDEVLDDTDDDDDEPQVDSDGKRTYGELKGKELIAEAKERNVEYKGKKVGEVRQALVDLDAESADEE